jgi:hypothetical protein
LMFAKAGLEPHLHQAGRWQMWSRNTSSGHRQKSPVCSITPVFILHQRGAINTVTRSFLLRCTMQKPSYVSPFACIPIEAPSVCSNISICFCSTHITTLAVSDPDHKDYNSTKYAFKFINTISIHISLILIPVRLPPQLFRLRTPLPSVHRSPIPLFKLLQRSLHPSTLDTLPRYAHAGWIVECETGNDEEGRGVEEDEIEDCLGVGCYSGLWYGYG